MLGGENVFHLIRGSAYLILLVHRTCDYVYIHCSYLWYIYMMMMYVFFTYLYMCCFFSIFIHMFLSMYAIYYFYFILKCLDEFCLKCFRNTDCQSLLAMNSFLAKFFKNLCYNRFYCIQQVNMSWVIYDFSHMFIYLLWFFLGISKGEIVRTYVIWC